MSGPYCMTGAFGSRIGEHIDQCGNSTWLRAEDLETRGLPTVQASPRSLKADDLTT